MDYLERLQQQGFEGVEDEEFDIDEKLDKLFKSQWWKRVWTIQEGVVANEHSILLWGPREISWAYLINLVERANFVTWAFERAVVSVITERQDLEFLLNIAVRRSEVNWTEKPTWAHDFADNSRLLSNHLKDYLFRRYDLVQEGASTGRKFTGVQHDEQASTIKITGTIVGSVAESQMIFADCYSQLARKKDSALLYQLFLRQHLNAFVPWLLQTLQDFTHIARKAWSKRFSPDEINAKIERGDVWRVALDGRSMDNLKSRIKPPMPKALVDEWAVLQRYSALDTWRHMLSQEKSGLAEDPESSIAKTLYRHIVAIFSTHPHWKGCLFTTTSGYVASAGMKAQSGDVVCILFGSLLPLVLRPQNDGTYIIIDAAYVEGIMEGEFLEDRSSYTDTEFVIS
ncbi:uncharacterized protein J4E79_007483 [Alternaria viburni]|uniref:uncharacterized protein n=1 Tax=Alternaria viburni TaxID=566460 RepID=UPI0020C208F6|nr:uncharacterized protein J4E79_007483 [Alternaria viburni]KAI4657410.1 hypothetical protein J4E79_007483 [Alternaria viburni]